MKESTTDAYLRGHPYVCGTRLFRQQVIPWGLRLSVKQEACAAVGVPCRKTTAWAAHLMREVNAPAGVKGRGLFEASDLCATGVQACREQRFPLASTLKSHRRRFKPGWKLKAGRSGRNRCRRHRTETPVITKPYGSARDRYREAGWLQVSNLGALHVVCSRKGTANKILGLVTDAPALSAADVMRTSATRWRSEQWGKDVQQLLGLGQYQHRSSRAAVIHRPLVCFASALLTHLRLERTGAPGHRTPDKAADLSTAAAQDQLRSLLGEDLLTDLKEERHDQSILEELERLRVA